jgi:hypothetical protein
MVVIASLLGSTSSSAARRLTHAVVQRPWKRRLVQDLGYGLAHEMFGMSADRRRAQNS